MEVCPEVVPSIFSTRARNPLLGSPPQPKLLMKKLSKSRPSCFWDCIDRLCSKKRGPVRKIDERVVHLLAAGQVRYSITDLYRLVNHIAAAFQCFRRCRSLAGPAASSLSSRREVQETTITRIAVFGASLQSWCASSSEKHVARVGSMDRCVAHRARLVFGGLVMGRSGGTLYRERVTLQAEQIYLAHAQVARIG